MGNVSCCQERVDSWNQIDMCSEMRVVSVSPDNISKITPDGFLFPKAESVNSGYSSDLAINF